MKENETKNVTYILDTDIPYMDNKTLLDKGPELFFVEMAGQWQNWQMIPHIDWKGTLNKTEKGVGPCLILA